MDLQQIHSTASTLWVVWFFILFAGVIAWAFRPSKRKKFNDVSRIPLRHDE